MNKQVFLDELRQALEGNISSQSIVSNIMYYDEYFTNEIRKGRSEEEIIDELGDPRLIAKTIIDTSGFNASTVEEDVNDEDTDNSFKGRNLNKYLLILIAVLVVVFVLSVVVKLVRFTIPLIPIIFIIFVVYKVLNDRNSQK